MTTEKGLINLIRNLELRDLNRDNFEERFEELFCNPECSIEYGTTKGVISVDDASVVVKIPFSGIPSKKNEFDMDYFRNGGWEGINQTDYCYTEMKLGEIAIERGLDEIFVPTRYACTIQGVPIYVQEKVNCEMYENDGNGLTEEDMHISEQYVNTDIDELWISWINHFYGEEMVKRVIEFCEDYGINDLSYYNLGWDACGRPVVFDYSGFMD